MDPSFPFNDRAFHQLRQTYRFNDNPLELFAQQRPSEHLSLSPGQPRSRGSSYTGSPTSPTSAHRPAVSQPAASAAGLQPGYFPTGSASMLQAMTSPVAPTFGHPFSDSMNASSQYAWENNFGNITTNEGGRMRVSRNNSEK